MSKGEVEDTLRGSSMWYQDVRKLHVRARCVMTLPARARQTLAIIEIRIGHTGCNNNNRAKHENSGANIKNVNNCKQETSNHGIDKIMKQE